MSPLAWPPPTSRLTPEQAWARRRRQWWAGRERRCQHCNRQFRRWTWTGWVDVAPDLHHVHGEDNIYAKGYEPADALVGMHPYCHDGHRRSLHTKHRRYARRQGWCRGRSVRPECRDAYYASLAEFTERYVRRGRGWFCWRAMFSWQEDLPPWEPPTR